MAAMAGALSPDELMADPAFARKVNLEWEETKRIIKENVRAAKRKFKRSVPDRFVEALKIYLRFEDFYKAGQWDNAFYCLHLYVECVLPLRLNRPQESGPSYERQAAEVQDTLDSLQGKLNRCMDGIRLQIIEKFRAEEEARRRHAAANPGRADRDSAAGARSGGTSRWKRASSSLTAKQAAMALDALRLDGKKTNVKLYGMDLGSASSKPLEAPQGMPPPAYDAAMASRHTSGDARLFSTVRHSEGLDDNQFRVKTITGDGNCAFRAIAQGQHDGQLSAEQETRLALQLRANAAAELRRCADEEMTGTGLTVEQIVLMKDDKFPTFSEYVNAMARNEYAGETEFWLLARQHNIKIAIYKPDSGGYEHLLTYGDSDAEPVKLLWRRGQFSEAGNHYDLLLDA